MFADYLHDFLCKFFYFCLVFFVNFGKLFWGQSWIENWDGSLIYCSQFSGHCWLVQLRRGAVRRHIFHSGLNIHFISKSNLIMIIPSIYSIVKDSNADLTVKFQKRPIISNSSGLAQGCVSLNIQNEKSDASLFSLRHIKILTNMQKKFFWNFSADSLDFGQS